jgi:hypothetical protein
MCTPIVPRRLPLVRLVGKAKDRDAAVGFGLADIKNRECCSHQLSLVVRFC